MLCPRCHGTHVVLVNGQQEPCPECQGMGEIHCCDGLTAQMEPREECLSVMQASCLRHSTQASNAALAKRCHSDEIKLSYVSVGRKWQLVKAH